MRFAVFSGGADRIAFHAGAVFHLLVEKSIRYNGYFGISTGALAAACLAQFSAGQERAAYDELLRLSNVRKGRIYKHWLPFGMLHGLWLSSVFNSKPLRQWFHDNISVPRIQNSDKVLGVYATNMVTYDLREFREDDANIDKGILASAAFPVGFPPVMIDGDPYLDGGIRAITPVKAAIMAAPEDDDLTLDVIVCHPLKATMDCDRKRTSVGYALSVIDVMSFEMLHKDLKMAKLYNRLIDAGGATSKRKVTINVIAPLEQLNESSMRFDEQEARYMRAQGTACARAETATWG